MGNIKIILLSDLELSYTAIMKISDRSQKLVSIVESKIPILITQVLTPDDIGFVTVSAIEISGDLGVCDVFVRSLGGPSTYLKKLQKKEKIIAHKLGEEIQMRRVMKVRFKKDRSVANVEFVEKNL